MNLCDFLFDLSFFLLKFPLVSIRVHFPVTEEKKTRFFPLIQEQLEIESPNSLGFGNLVCVEPQA